MEKRQEVFLEEKLYFKPANYGKGKKKEQIKVKGNHKVFKLIGLLLFLLIIIVIIIWLLHGKTTVTGRYPENIKNESLECNIANLTYEKTNRISPAKTDTKVTMIFYGLDQLSSINFRYTMHLASNKEAGEAEAITHVQLAENLADSGLSYEEFNNKFTRVDSDLTLSLYSSEELKKDTMHGYFLINKLQDTNQYPSALKEYRKNYEAQGFTCKSSIDKKE